MKKKIGLLTIKITAKYFILRTNKHTVFGIRWINPWRLITLAVCKSEYSAVGPALLNFGLSFGYMPYRDTTGVDLRLEVLGKGFTYTKEYYSDRKDMPAQELFRWIK